MEVMAGDTGAPGFIPLIDDTTPFAPVEGLVNPIATALNNALKTAAFSIYPDLATLNLPANAGTVVGQHASVNADSTTSNNVDYYWNGSVWVRTLPETTIAFVNPGTLTAGATIYQLVIPARPYATYVDYDVIAQVGNVSGSTFAVAPSTTAGTLTGPGYVPFSAGAGAWVSINQSGRLTLAANSAATVTFAANGGGGTWHAAIKSRRTAQ